MYMIINVMRFIITSPTISLDPITFMHRSFKKIPFRKKKKSSDIASARQIFHKNFFSFFFIRKTSPGSEKKYFEKFAGHLQYIFQTELHYSSVIFFILISLIFSCCCSYNNDTDTAHAHRNVSLTTISQQHQ
jgi:hypothetical protein